MVVAASVDADVLVVVFFFSSRRRHTRFKCDWSSDVCSSDLSAANTSRCQRAGSDRDSLYRPVEGSAPTGSHGLSLRQGSAANTTRGRTGRRGQLIAYPAAVGCPRLQGGESEKTAEPPRPPDLPDFGFDRWSHARPDRAASTTLFADRGQDGTHALRQPVEMYLREEVLRASCNR